MPFGHDPNKWTCERCGAQYETEDVTRLRAVAGRYPKCDKPVGEQQTIPSRFAGEIKYQMLCGGTVWQPLEVDHG